MARKRTQKKSARVKSKSIKSYYGKISPFLIIVIVIAVLAVAGVGYFLFGKGGSPLGSKMGSKGGSMMMQKVTEDDFAYVEDELLRKHFVAQANQTKFRVTSTSSGFGGASVITYDMRGDSVSYQMTQTGEMESDMIMIGDTTYIKDFSDNTWWKQTQKPEEMTEVNEEIDEYSFDPEETQAEFVKMTYNNLGEEACGDLMCHKYEELDPNNDTASAGRRLFWFDTKDYLLRKDLSEFGEFSSESEYSYEDVSVDTPSPTKDVPEGRSIYEYMGGMAPSGDTQGVPSQEEIDAMMKQYQESGEITLPSSEEMYFDSGEY